MAKRRVQAPTRASTSSRRETRPDMVPKRGSALQSSPSPEFGHRRHQPAEDAVARAGDGDPLVVRGRVVVVRRGVRAAGPVALADDAERVVGRGHVVGQAEDALEERDVDHLPLPAALALAQGGQGAEGAEQPGAVVRDRRRSRDRRRPVRLAGEVGQAAERLGHPPESGAGGEPPRLPVGGDAEQHHSRVDRPQAVVAQVPALERARPEVLDHQVAVAHQAERQGLAPGVTQVAGHRAPPPALQGPEEGPPAHLVPQIADGIAAPGLLHLDHGGPLLGQQAGGEGGGDEGAEVEDAEAVERAHPLTSW